MYREKMHIPLFQNTVLWAVLISVCYLTYLFFSSQTLISADAYGYQNLGILLYEGKFEEFLTSGPNREPVYPLIVSLAMHIAGFAEVSYLSVMKLIQISLLLLTQVIMWQLMKRLEIRRNVAALAILYLGISPAMVNSTFSLFSEVGTYPLILAVVWLSAVCMEQLLSGRVKNAVFLGLCFSLLFVLLTLSKAIFEYIFYAYLIIFALIAAWCAIRKEWSKIGSFIFFLITLIAVFTNGIAFYKSLNFKYNNHYAITDRGPAIFYGETVKRTQTLTPRRFFAGLSSVPGEGICPHLFSAEDCYYWSWKNRDEIGFGRLQELSDQGLTGTEQYQKLIEQGKKTIFSNPLQYFFLTVVESFKMPFWESTKVGYVAYPPWLTELFAFMPFNYLVKLLMALLTVFSLFYFLRNFWLKEAKLLFSNSLGRQKIWLSYFLLQFIVLFTLFYALTTIVIRYIFPLVPLFLIMIAFTIDKLFQHQRALNAE